MNDTAAAKTAIQALMEWQEEHAKKAASKPEGRVRPSAKKAALKRGMRRAWRRPCSDREQLPAEIRIQAMHGSEEQEQFFWRCLVSYRFRDMMPERDAAWLAAWRVYGLKRESWA